MRETICVSLITFLTTVAFYPSDAAPRNALPGRYALYSPDDNVFQLNGTTIIDKVFNSDRAWLVEFYAHWCGHCIRFAPVYKLFAAELYDWRNVAVVAALNCADESNTDVCAEFDINTYPTLRFFPPRYPQNSTGNNNSTSVSRGIPVQKGDGSVSNLKRKLIDLLEPQFSNLLSFTNHSGNGSGGLAELWSSNETDVSRPTAIVTVFENTTSYLGKEIALRLSLHTTIKVFRFSERNELYYSARSNRTSWPAVLFVGPDGIPKPVVISERKPVDSVCRAVLQLAGIETAPQSLLESSTSGRPEPALQASNGTLNKTNTDVVSMEDLLRTLRDSLYTEVLLSRNVSGRKLEALKSYLNIVFRYFPADKLGIKSFFNALYNWILPKQVLHSTEMKGKLKALEQNYNPWDGVDLRGWEDCKASIPGRRGYTCGLWRLSHTLTLVAVKVNGTEGAMDAINGYVENFFGCQECSEHFRAMVKRDDILAQKSTTAQALWLWKAHNEVNLRTKGTLSEDPAYPKGRYPSRQLCPKCFDANGNYVASSVLKYLLDVYVKPMRRNEKTVEETRVESTATGSRRLRDMAYSIMSFFI